MFLKGPSPVTSPLGQKGGLPITVEEKATEESPESTPDPKSWDVSPPSPALENESSEEKESEGDEETEVYDEATEGAFEKLALDALDKAKQGRSPLNKADMEAVVEWLAWYRSSPLSEEKTESQVKSSDLIIDPILECELNKDAQERPISGAIEKHPSVKLDQNFQACQVFDKMPEGAESRKRCEITRGVEASPPGQVRSSDFVEFSVLSCEKDVEPVRPFAGPKVVYHRDATGDLIDAHQVFVNVPEGVSAVPFGGEGVEIPSPSPSGVVVAGGGGAGQVFDKRPMGGDA
ncbi:hypothetical protein U1Q18_040496 [Sarracenia purpurea var. burkii]